MLCYAMLGITPDAMGKKDTRRNDSVYIESVSGNGSGAGLRTKEINLV